MVGIYPGGIWHGGLLSGRGVFVREGGICPGGICPRTDLTPLQLVTDCLPLKKFESHRQVASESVDLTIFENSTLWLTVSNATVRSTATQTVRSGGFLWLKPVAISLVSC